MRDIETRDTSLGIINIPTKSYNSTKISKIILYNHYIGRPEQIPGKNIFWHPSPTLKGLPDETLTYRRHPRGHESNTIRVSNRLIEELYEKYADLRVSVLDLFKADLPSVAGENIDSKYKLMTGQELDDHHKSSWEAIEASIKRFLDADIYVITTPMWNFGIPYALKYYIDAIVQPGYLFRYNERGIPEGLVHEKKMIVVTSRGGDYSPNTYIHSLDFVEPYLRAIFNFVGITDLHFINAQPMDVSAALRRDALLKAIDEAKAMVADNHWNQHVPAETIEFPEGVKPAPLEANI